MARFSERRGAAGRGGTTTSGCRTWLFWFAAVRQRQQLRCRPDCVTLVRYATGVAANQLPLASRTALKKDSRSLRKIVGVICSADLGVCPGTCNPVAVQFFYSVRLRRGQGNLT